ILSVLVCGAIARGGSAISVEPISNPSGIRIAVAPTSNAGWALLEVVDPASGVCLKTVHAGRVTARDHFAVITSDALPAGPYRLRYRENVDLALAGEMKRPDAAMPNWLNPTDLALAGPWIYVRDGGQPIEAKDPASIAEKAAK